MEKKAPPVRILEVCKVAPPPDSQSSAANFSLPFTYFDALFLKIPPTERLFFYYLSNSLSHPPSLNSILSHLKLSLSLTLHHFPPLAGNLTWPPDSPKPTILYTPNDAVSLTVADADAAHFTHFSTRETRPVEFCRPLLPNLPASDTSVPVMALQITLFPTAGLSIGISTHHAFVDGKSFIIFMKSWAHIFNRTQTGDHKAAALPPELTPFFDRSVIKDPKQIDMRYINYWLKKSSPTGETIKSLQYFPNLGVSPDMVRGTFEFTHTDIKKLKKQTRFSSFVVAFAYLSICAVKAARIEQKSKKVYLGFYADWRGRLQPAVPSSYFGNCGGSHGVFAAAGEMEDDDGLKMISEKIREAIEAVERDAMEGAEESLSKWEKVEEEIKFVGVVGSPRLGVYGVDFGWGRPENVVMASIERTGSVSLADCRDGEGIEVGLVLPASEMEAFGSLFADGLKALG